MHIMERVEQTIIRIFRVKHTVQVRTIMFFWIFFLVFLVYRLGNGFHLVDNVMENKQKTNISHKDFLSFVCPLLR